MSHLQRNFTKISKPGSAEAAPCKPKAKRAAPLSVRLSNKEREILERAAGDMSLNAYIRVRFLMVI